MRTCFIGYFDLKTKMESGASYCLNFLIEEMKRCIHKHLQNNCVGCQRKTRFHDCLAMSFFSKYRLCFDAAWGFVDPELKERAIKAIVQKELFSELGKLNL